MGRCVVGNDINPLSQALCKPRFHPPTLEQIEERLEAIFSRDCVDLREYLAKAELEDLLVFYHPRTLQKICALRAYMMRRGKLDTVDEWIRMVATNRLTGHSAGFFSVYTLPPNQAVTAERQRKINEKRSQAPQQKDVEIIILKKSKSLLKSLTLEDVCRVSSVNVAMHTGKADETQEIASSSVDLVVTSPPFLDVVDYRSDNWLRCWFNGIDSASLPITQIKKQEEWVEEMSKVMRELRRVLKPDGVIAFEVGEVKGGKLLLEELVIKAAHQAGLQCDAVLINDQQFTKTANCWGVSNQSKGTNTNRIVILRRKT